MQNFYIKETSKRVIYRDSLGRFISKEKAIKQRIQPTIIERVEYRTPTGQFVSKKKVKKSKKKVFERKDWSEIEGVQATVLGQQVQGEINFAINQGLDVAIFYKGIIYPIKDLNKLTILWNELNRYAVDLYKNKKGTLYYEMNISQKGNSVVYDFSSLLPSEIERKGNEFKTMQNKMDKKIRSLIQKYKL